jgi:hypothetical protein
MQATGEHPLSITGKPTQHGTNKKAASAMFR